MNLTIHWYIDGLHQVHEDCQGLIGCLMTMGKGAACSSFNKMKCNTWSSTETKLILLHNKLPDDVWTRYFVECQWYEIDKYIIFQDNMSALSLEKNGRILSSKRTKHIKAKFFLIKDYYDVGEIDMWYCPTDVMWADVLTKPLQGQKFREMCAFLQNCPRDYDEDFELRTDEVAQNSMNQWVHTVASSWEWDKSPCCVSWADETGVRPASRKHVNKRHPKTGPRGQTMWTKYARNRTMVDKPCGQKICKEQWWEWPREYEVKTNR